MKNNALIFLFFLISTSYGQVRDTIVNKSVELEDVVISGTLKPVKRLESPVPVEIYSPAFLKKNPTSNVY